MAWTIGLVDTATALLAGLAIFPILFATSIQSAEGPGLMFVTLPMSLGNKPGGALLSILFFLLLFLAAFTSSLAMLEPFVSWLTENHKVKQFKAAFSTQHRFLCLAGWPDNRFFLQSIKRFQASELATPARGTHRFLIIDFLVSNLMLPINALMIALLRDGRCTANLYRHKYD